MTVHEAVAQLRRLGLGLAPDDAGVARLLERIARHEDSEALRDALGVLGARALLDAEAARP